MANLITPFDRTYFNSLIEEFPLDTSATTTSYSSISIVNLNKIDGISRLPFVHRILLESLVRNEHFEDAAKIVESIDRKQRDNVWDFQDPAVGSDVTVAGNDVDVGNNVFVTVHFFPARVLFQDFSCLTPLLDLAALRDAADKWGIDPAKIKSSVPIDVLLDHSLTSDFKRSSKTPSTAKPCTSSEAPSLLSSASQRRSSTIPTPKEPSTSTSKTSTTTPHSAKYIPPHQRGRDGAATRAQQPSGRGVGPPTTFGSVAAAAAAERAKAAAATALTPEEAEWRRNRERLEFIKWCGEAFDNVSVIPPVSSRLPHQVYLEYTCKILSCLDGKIFPDSVLGTDTHTSLVNGLGILGLTTGSVECESALLGEGFPLPLPPVVGFHLRGHFNDYVTSTDVVLAIVKKLKASADLVSGKIVEFYGPVVPCLSCGDRIAVAQMSPEAGVLAAFFPFDDKTRCYFETMMQSCSSFRSPSSTFPLPLLQKYLSSSGFFQRHEDDSSSPPPLYSAIVEFDVSTVCALATERGSDHRVPLDKVKEDFQARREEILKRRSKASRSSPSGGVGRAPSPPPTGSGIASSLTHGDVIAADIAPYTNATFPSVLLASGLLAKNAVDVGLKLPSYVSANLRLPGCRVADYYLRSVLASFHALGFACNDVDVAPFESSSSVVLASVMSGKGVPEIKCRANYQVYPPLVVAFALAGNVAVDLKSASLGKTKEGADIFLRDLWPNRREIQQMELDVVKPEIFLDSKAQIESSVQPWNELETRKSPYFPWNLDSTFIQRPKYLDHQLATTTTATTKAAAALMFKDCRVVAIVGDGFKADHISLAGSIEGKSEAGRFLSSRGLIPRDFNSYGSRSGNHEVMTRGTFASGENKMTRSKGPKTVHVPSGREMSVFEACEKYNPRYREGVVDTPLVVIGGKDFGKGTTREWAVKGPWLLGVRVIIAESFQANYRNSLLHVGILPLLFENGQNADNLQISGKETFSFFFDGEREEKEDVDDVDGRKETCSSSSSSDVNDRVTIILGDGRYFNASSCATSKMALTRITSGGFLAQAFRRLTVEEV